MIIQSIQYIVLEVCIKLCSDGFMYKEACISFWLTSYVSYHQLFVNLLIFLGLCDNWEMYKFAK